MAQNAADAVLDDRALAAFDKVCDLQLPVIDDFRGARLQDLEILITGWGCPPIDEAVLDAAPKLRAVVHTAGSVRAHITQACWDRGIEVSSAAAANAVPVAEYTVAMILLSGKRALERARDYKTVRRREEWLSTPRTIGNFGRTIGILSASLIGRRVIELLRPYDLNLLLHDPYVLEGEIDVPLVSIEELFERSDLVSVHTPLLSTTHGLVSRELIGMMRPDAVLLNTARGAVVDQDALAEAARRGGRTSHPGCHRSRSPAAGTSFVGLRKRADHAASRRLPGKRVGPAGAGLARRRPPRSSAGPPGPASLIQ
nr:NAD(P)-dependent oxidoreductase [Fodinicola feengrottensis]